MNVQFLSTRILLSAAVIAVAVVNAATVPYAHANERSSPVILQPLTLEEVERDGSYRLLTPATALVPTTRMASGYTRATCTYSGGMTKSFDWTGKNPSTCGQYYRLYVNGKVVFAAQSRSGPNIWGVVGQGYTALQKWCSSNSMTCGVVTAVGTLTVASLLG